jgi:hypothetical protein
VYGYFSGTAVAVVTREKGYLKTEYSYPKLDLKHVDTDDVEELGECRADEDDVDEEIDEEDEDDRMEG